MTLTTSKTVRELALEIPNATRVFEKLGLDYCCGGAKSLQDACTSAGLSVEDVIANLEKAAAEPKPADDRVLQSGSLAELIAHIVNTHHVYVRQEIPRLNALLDKVCGVHGERRPELKHIRGIFRGVGQELTMHMMKEEAVLFPYIERMEEQVIQKEPVLPAPFGTVANPVRSMMEEHDSAGTALKAMREASGGYHAPDDACVSYQTLYSALEAFEKDLHQHIHLENNSLFPRALRMETGG